MNFLDYLHLYMRQYKVTKISHSVSRSFVGKKTIVKERKCLSRIIKI